MVTATQNGKVRKSHFAREKQDGTLQVRISKDLRAKMDRRARSERRSASNLARLAIKKYCADELNNVAAPTESAAQLTLTLDQFEHIRRVAAIERKSIQDCIMERMGLRLADAETPKKPAVNGTLNGHHRPVEPAPAVDAAGPNPTAAKRPRLGEDATPRYHPLGALYIEVAKMNEHAAKMLKTLRRIRCRGTDDLRYYLESNHETVGASHAAGQSAMLEEAFDDLQSMLRSVHDEMSASYEAVMVVVENAEENHGLRIVK